MFVCVVSLSQMLYVKCMGVLSRYLRCYMLNVWVVVSLSQMLYGCVVSLSQMLYVKCMGMLSRYLSVFSLFQMLYVKCMGVFSRYLRCYMLNVWVCCLVISDVVG